MNGIFLALLLLLAGCTASHQNTPELVSIHLIDREGKTEAVSNPDRIKSYGTTDFLQSQPYQKVMRVYSRDENGSISALITTYHPNGQVKQYLEVVNNRAFGAYREWYDNGTCKVEATVIEGTPDISIAAEKSWLFDGICQAWSETGKLLATIPYSKGQLEGVANYYHPNGTIWKELPYYKNALNGEMRIYLNSGDLFQTTSYVNNVKEGLAIRYWSNEQVAAEEHYVQGRLMSGCYTNFDGKSIAGIEEGHGVRAIFGKTYLSELQEYHYGVEAGAVQIFDLKGRLIKLYRIKNGLKHGEELVYFTLPGKEKQPKLSMVWYEGKMRGLVKTWYENGVQESQREISDNVRNGVATAWYADGQLMLIEEYDQDKLKKGDYFRKGEKYPISQVINGEGVVTYFDPEGNYLRKVNYLHGKPDA